MSMVYRGLLEPKEKLSTSQGKIFPSCLVSLLSISIWLLLTIADCHLVETPNNTAVIRGNENVVFKCKSDEGFKLKLYMQLDDTSGRQILYDDSVYRNAASFCDVKKGGPGELIMNLTTTYEAARTYICQEPPTHTEFSADLIILNKSRFEMNVSDDLVFIKCFVEFRGNWAPELEWSYNGSSIVHGVFPSTVSNTMVSSTLVIPTSSVDRIYTCTTKFNIKGKPENTTSRNVPDYISSSELKVEAYKKNSNDNEGQPVGTVISTIVLAVILALFVIAVLLGLFATHRRKLRVKPMKTEMFLNDQKDI